jgi:RNA polymerase sigma-70 factor (ECF subfamily)
MALDRTGRWDVAEEIAQQAIVIAWEQRETLRDRSALGAWLQRIVLNLCVSWQRREIRTLPLPVRDLSGASQQTVMESVMRRETIRDARLALANVPLKSRMALLMHLSGYSYRDIGEFLDLPASTIRGRIARARGQLRRDLADRLGLSLEEKGEPGR